MGKKKPKKNPTSSTKDHASAQPATEEQRPARKRGRPRKVVIEEKDPPEGVSEGSDAQEQESANKRPRAATEEQQPQPQQEGTESSCSAVAEVSRQEEKPQSRGRRKGRPRKST